MLQDIERIQRALFNSIRNRDKQIFDDLVDLYLLNLNNVEYFDISGIKMYPLHEAIQREEKEMTLKLLDKNVKVDFVKQSRAKNETEPLNLSMLLNQPQIALRLIEKGCQLNFQERQNGKTALMISIERNQSQIGMNLIEKGCALNQQDCDGNTALLL